MEENLQLSVSAIQERFDAKLSEFRGDVTLWVSPENISDVCRLLRDEFEFKTLAEQTAVDYWPEETPRFHVVYGLRSYSRNLILFLRVPLNGNAPSMPSLVEIFPNANWFERELWDMFGIHFDGHPDLRRILMPHDWEGHPLRKDYPLGYEEVQFSFNFEEINVRKPYAKD
jgi:NADH-quinone oxidoreductase subunit C